jgi:ABC-type glutathione transport system ATPase component
MVESKNALNVENPQVIEVVPMKSQGEEVAPLTSGGKTDLAAANNYMDYLTHLQAVWKDQPKVQIDFKNVSYTIEVPESEVAVNTVATKLLGVRELFRRTPTKEFRALHNLSGSIKPGTTTLVLAPRGHGRSFFLKSLAGLLNGQKELSGEIRYNGVTYKEAEEKGLQVAKLCAYVDQVDSHNSLLTVREVLQFALDNSVADINLLNDPQIKEMHKKRVDLMIDLLGLREAENTIIGNDMIRGVSGGNAETTSFSRNFPFMFEADISYL